jgi:hypothetical protein
MKCISSVTLMVLLCIITTSGFCQTAKPGLFTAYPATIICAENELSSLFIKTAGQQATVQFGTALQFSGTVTSNVVKYSNLQSVVLRSAALHNTIFHLSKRTLSDNSVVYTGRILNDGYADGYELRRNAEGKYQLTRIETAKVIQDCTH